MKSRIFLLLFFLFAAGDLVNVWMDLPYRYLTKSLIIPALVLYFVSISPRKKSYQLLLIALFFAWLGDVFLLFTGKNFFLLGLGSFLLMQILYSAIFYKNRKISKGKLAISILVLGLFCAGFNYYLYPFTTAIRIPVIAYSIAIAIMALTGINRDNELAGYNHVFFGVLLFVISDTVLAFNSFGPGFWKGGFWVMLTYILAQYCIVEGYGKHLRSSIQ